MVDKESPIESKDAPPANAIPDLALVPDVDEAALPSTGPTDSDALPQETAI